MPSINKLTARPAARVHGFTLIELMMVIAIVGIIVSVGWSYYDKQVTAMRRRDAVTALTAASNDMEKCKTDNGSYTGCAPAAASSPKGLYKISVTITGGGQGYTLKAKKNFNDDPNCETLTLTNLGIRSFIPNGTPPAGMDYHRCWGD